MKNMKWMVAALLATFSLQSCLFLDDDPFSCERGVGPTVTKVLELPSFSGIDLQISGKVILIQGPEQHVEVEGQENIIDLLRLSVSNDTWNIRFDDCVRQHEELVFYITLPDIGYVSISGSGRVYGDNVFEGNDINLRISGSGDMDLALDDFDEVDIRISGSGDIRLEGEANEFDLDISGSGDYEAFGLQTQKGDIKISGSGDAEVYVTDRLDVRITGSGSVYYKGNPILNVHITGSGRVQEAN
ncbi:MAG: head GIN domain-containing protein [Saprospiraceae bacterium]